jgi:conjugal transfer pilus assembly protein TraB
MASDPDKKKPLDRLLGVLGGGKKPGPAKDAGKNDDEPVRIKIGPDEAVRKSRNRWMLVAGAVAGLIFVVSVMLSGGLKQHVPPPEQKKPEGIDLTPGSVLQQNFETRTQTDLNQLKQDSESAKRRMDETDQAIKDIKSTLDKIQESIKDLRATPPPPPATLPSQTYVPPPPVPLEHGALPKGTGPAPPETPPASEEPIVVTPPSSSAEGKSGGTVGVNASHKENPMAGYVPSGSFAPVVLLTGVEAGTAETSQSDPQPVLMRVERDAIAPGLARYEVASCFLLGSAHASLSTERAYIRLARLSCVDKHAKLVIDNELKGYVVDSDGMFGLRGKLVQRQGALLAKTLLAGFASGLASALGQAQGTTYVGTFGAGQTISGDAALRGAAFGGASRATDQLAQFYLKQAESIFPVVEVEPKRKAGIVLTEGTSLRWTDYGSLYVTEVKPEK